MKAKKAIQIIFATTIFLLLLLSPLLYYSYSEEHYKTQMQKNNVYETIPEADEYATNIIGFLKGQNELKGNYTENEISHMHDVKRLYNAASIIFYVSILAITALILLGIKRKEKKEYYTTPLIKGSIALLAFNLLIILLATFFFDTLFTAFHEIFFPMGNWQFPPNKTLITLLPEQFFINTTQKIFLTSTMLGITTLLTTMYIRKK